LNVCASKQVPDPQWSALVAWDWLDAFVPSLPAKACAAFVAFVDRRWPGGPNCYRRVLFEVGLDGGAAAEIVQLGFQGSGEIGSGHAWLGPGLASDDGGRTYDAIVSI